MFIGRPKSVKWRVYKPLKGDLKVLPGGFPVTKENLDLASRGLPLKK